MAKAVQLNPVFSNGIRFQKHFFASSLLKMWFKVATMHQEVSYWIGENFERHDDVKQNQLVAGLSSGHPSGHMHLGKITLTGLSGLMQNSYNV